VSIFENWKLYSKIQFLGQTRLPYIVVLGILKLGPGSI